MLKKLEIRDKARQRIAEIYNYTLHKWGEEQADSYTYRIHQKMHHIAEGEAFSTKIDSKFRLKGYKCKFTKHNIIWSEGGKEKIIIHDILHESMDIDGRLDD